ncbi:DASS family sodium-coupled anion symporter [Isoptericola halotolerans]|uniref:Sodium-dependent dicarboxylate transporter SdcS n=1 Tax=Isoptericola halotolerans TaxID=300560 RepID=A0ABX2A7M1_9MICO|nr:DASS family sodium-coupled anion symporter [Isoptericola halotolerans]NOV98606.1 sodium-dependent dicarboxylate transporter 2/3/5 [Isoptericola halotolerans]
MTTLEVTEERARRSAGPRPGADEEHLPGARLWIGRVLGPVLGLAAYLLLPQDAALTDGARATAAVAITMAVWWMTEALPLAVTSLVPIVAFPVAGVLSVNDATAPYASPTVFLFMGGFMLALAMQKWNLHKRIALVVMRAIGTKPRQLVLGVMIATAFLSMWVSNTATTLMMLPIGISVLALVASQDKDTRTNDAGAAGPAEGKGPVSQMFGDKDTRNFAVCLMLSIAFAATIGGLATLIGSPPNLILAGFAEESLDMTIGFADWMKIGVPLSAVFLVVAWLLLTRVVYRTRLTDVVGGREVIDAELAKLGRMSRGEWIVAAVFTTTALLWVFRDVLTDSGLLPFMEHVDDAMIAIAAAVVLFLVPASSKQGKPVMTLDWRTAQSGIPWGVLLLFGGGLSLARAVQETELSGYIGTQLDGLGVLPAVLLVAAVCLVVLALTELTSNTATAATFLPVLAGVALGIGIDPMLLLVPAAFAATCSFMLPVGTPPNAIVFGSGYVTMGQMLRAGVWLNLIGTVLITGAMLLLGGWALGITV